MASKIVRKVKDNSLEIANSLCGETWKRDLYLI